MPKLQLLAYFLLSFRVRSCAKKRWPRALYLHRGLHQQLPVRDTFDKSWLSICSRRTNESQIVISESLHERWVSKHSSPPQDSNVLRSVFAHTAVSDSVLRESTSYFSAFYAELWRLATREGGQLLQNSCLLNIPAIPDNRLDFVLHENNWK